MPVIKKIIFLFSCLLLCVNLEAQMDADSLLKKLKELPNDTTSISTISRYGNIQKKINLKIALSLYLEAYNRAKSLHNDFMIARSALMVASTYGLMSEFEKESNYLAEAKKTAEKINNKPLQVKIGITLANMYSYNDQTKKAVEIHNQTLKICEELNLDEDKATIYNNLGGILYSESNLNADTIKKAIGFVKRAISIIEKSKSKNEIINDYSNLGLMYCDIQQYDSALYFLSKSKIYIDKKKLPDDLITYYSYMARIYTDLKDFKKAEANYFASLEESKKLNNPEWIAEGYLALSDMYVAKKEFENANIYLNKYYTIHDSIVNVVNFSKAADIQNKLEREKKEAELNQLKAEQAKNRIFTIGLIIVSLLLVVSGGMMYSRFKIKSESEKKLKSQNEIISQKNKDITDSINYSRKIQDAILPSNKNITELFPDNFVLYKPKDIISGDFYWCAQNGNLKFFAVADCTGHGVPGALMSMLGTSLLKEIILTKNIKQTGEVLNELRKLVINALDEHSENKDGMDIALICIDEKNRALHFSGANNGILVFQNNSFTELKPNKQPIGKYEKMEGFSTQTIELTAETIVYLYTDGFADQFGGPKGKKFKYRQLNDLIREITALPLAQQKEILNERFGEWKQLLEQVDDVCLAGLKISV